MLVNWEKKYLFVHVPKTGGTSITQVLKRDCNRPILPLRALGYTINKSSDTKYESLYPIIGYPYHSRANDLCRIWGPERYNELFSFAFVRNPWDMAVSLYFYIQRKWDHPQRRAVRNLGSFEAYLDWKPEYGRHRQQSDWVYDSKGTQLVKHIGRFETYEEDANAILRKLGRSENVPHANATKHKSYYKYYNDRTAEKVAKLYCDDIMNFGYSF